MAVSDSMRVVLKGLGYTPRILEKKTNLSRYKANKVFEDNYSLGSIDFLHICKLIGVNPNAFMADIKE